MTPEELADRAQLLWRGIPFLWQEELRAFLAYEAHVGQEVTLEGLTLWMTRVQAGECPVAGHGCSLPRGGRFCEHHKRDLPAGM